MQSVTANEPVLTDTILSLPGSIPKKAQMLDTKVVVPLLEQKSLMETLSETESCTKLDLLILTWQLLIPFNTNSMVPLWKWKLLAPQISTCLVRFQVLPSTEGQGLTMTSLPDVFVTRTSRELGRGQQILMMTQSLGFPVGIILFWIWKRESVGGEEAQVRLQVLCSLTTDQNRANLLF